MTVYLRALVKDIGIIKEVATPFTYPGGELHLKNVGEYDSPNTVWIADVRFGTEQDLTYAALLASIAHQRQAPFVLLLPYLPAARSDKVAYHDDPVGVQVYADRVNAMNPQQVIGIDAHSPVVHRYLRNLTELKPGPLVRRALGYRPALETGWDDDAQKYDAVIAPDKGAVQRAIDVAGMLGRHGVDIYHADKKRDLKTGKILGIELTEALPKRGRYLVVDDICDGGGTFMGLAEALDLPGKDQLGLWVTHGIFSGKANLLRRDYGQIYTTDSHPGHGRVGVATTIVPVEAYLTQHLKEFG